MKSFDGSNGQGGVAALVPSGESEAVTGRQSFGFIGRDKFDRAPELEGATADDGSRFGRGAGAKAGDLRFDDAGFFPGDSREGIAQPSRVIPRNARDDADQGRNDVRGVEPAA